MVLAGHSVECPLGPLHKSPRALGGGGVGLGAGVLEEGTRDPRREAEARVHLEARERHRGGMT